MIFKFTVLGRSQEDVIRKSVIFKFTVLGRSQEDVIRKSVIFKFAVLGRSQEDVIFLLQKDPKLNNVRI